MMIMYNLSKIVILTMLIDVNSYYITNSFTNSSNYDIIKFSIGKIVLKVIILV